jgi:glycosyltransferase involved in cell wall biosynthesis
VTSSSPVPRVHFVVPANIDDPAQPSGGNRYDRRVSDALRALGIDVREHAVGGDWPAPDTRATNALAAAVAGIPDGATILIDGLIASAVPEVLVPHARRLTLVVLVHLPLGYRPDRDAETVRARERDVLSAASGIVVPSSFTRTWLVDNYLVAPQCIHVASPGNDPAALAPGTPGGGGLLCVGAVAPHKGHDTLIAALAELVHLPWRLTIVGALVRDRDFVDRVRRQAAASAIDDRVDFTGPLTAAEVDHAYTAADLVVLPSQFETYGMVVTESLSHGVPVLATEVGGIAEALGETPAGRRPGILVAPGDSAALAAALRCWLADASLRQTLREAARQRRDTLTSWTTTGARVAQALADAVAARTPAADLARLVLTNGDGR